MQRISDELRASVEGCIPTGTISRHHSIVATVTAAFRSDSDDY
jgi:hypothetical protein